jgi:uncharacterized damage-inducible protein DinB
MNRAIIDQFETGGVKLKKAIDGLSRDELLWIPAAGAGVGAWSIQQIIIHMLDSDLIWSSRMKLIIAEDNPTILGYDESKFAAKLFYQDQDAQSAIALFGLNRQQFSKVLRKLPDSSFSRAGNHNERGTITLGDSVAMMVEHVAHHLGFVAKKREKLGKPLED